MAGETPDDASGIEREQDGLISEQPPSKLRPRWGRRGIKAGRGFRRQRHPRHPVQYGPECQSYSSRPHPRLAFVKINTD